MSGLSQGILGHNPNGYWRLVDGPGAVSQVRDHSGNDYHGILTGAGVFGEPGLINNDYESSYRTGIDSLIEVTYPALNAAIAAIGTGDLTVGCWFKNLYGTDDGTKYLLNWESKTSTTVDAIQLRYSGSGQPNIRLEDAGAGITASADGPAGFKTGVVQSVIGVRESGVQKIYVNGAIQLSQPASTGALDTIEADHSFFIGSQTDGTDIYIGWMQEAFLIAGTALTQAEVTALFDLGNDAALFKFQGDITENISPVDFKVRVFNWDTGYLLGEAKLVAGTYNVPVSGYNGLGLVTACVDSGIAWRPGRNYVLDEYVVPLNPIANNHFYKVTGAGVAAANEPTWPTNGGNVVNGAATFADQGPLVKPEVQGPLPAIAA